MKRWIHAGRRFCMHWGDPIRAGVLAALAIYVLSGRFTNVRFERERIDVQVQPGLLHVHGLYRYQNVSCFPALLTLSTPFPIDRDHPRPDALAVAEVNEGGAINELQPGGPREAPTLRVVFRPHEAKWIQLDYWQATRTQEGCYLLTTTRAWRRPIAEASFRLSLPGNYLLVASNYGVTETPGGLGGTAFSFSRTDFFPDQDWRFRWQQGPGVETSSAGGVP